MNSFTRTKPRSSPANVKIVGVDDSLEASFRDGLKATVTLDPREEPGQQRTYDYQSKVQFAIQNPGDWLDVRVSVELTDPESTWDKSGFDVSFVLSDAKRQPDGSCLVTFTAE